MSPCWLAFFPDPLHCYLPCPKSLPRKPQVDPLQQELDETRQARDELSTRLDSLIEEMELQKGDLLQLREAADQVLACLCETGKIDIRQEFARRRGGEEG